MDYSQYWPKERPAWLLRCVATSTPKPGRQPAGDPVDGGPRADAGQARRAPAPTAMLYYGRTGRRTEIAGIFFKLYRHQSDTEGVDRLPRPAGVAIPPVRTSDSRRRRLGDAGNDAGDGAGAWVLLLAIPSQQDRPLQGAVAGAAQSRLGASQSGEDFGHERVDPALLEAAEAYFKEHPEARPRSRRTRRCNCRRGRRLGYRSTRAQVDPALKEAAEQFIKEHPEDDLKRPS